MNGDIPKPCLPDANLANVEEVALRTSEGYDLYLSNGTIAQMAREIREWRAWYLKQDD